MLRLDGGDIPFSITVNFFTNNISEITKPSKSITVSRDLRVSNKVTASTIKIKPSRPDDETLKIDCGTAWGTFFGAIVVNFSLDHPSNIDPCQRSFEAAMILAPHMPKSPSEMRPAP